MKEFLSYLLSLIVDHPQKLIVEEVQLDQINYQYNISAQKEDIGKIIGKEGKIIQAIRNVTKILAVKQGLRIRIQIA